MHLPRTVPHPRVNRLLATLPPEDFEALLPQMEIVSLGMKTMVYELYRPISHAYFPLNGIISLLARTDEGESVELSTIGSEGMIGVPIFLGATAARPSRFRRFQATLCILRRRCSRTSLTGGELYIGYCSAIPMRCSIKWPRVRLVTGIIQHDNG